VRLGVTQKLWLSLVGMILAVLVPVGVALNRGVSEFYYAQRRDEMTEFGARIAAFLTRAPEPGALEAVRAIAEIAGMPLLVLDTSGRVTTGTGPLAGEVGRVLDSPQIRAARAGTASVSLTRSDALPGSLLVAAVPIPAPAADGTRAGGVVLLFQPASEVEEALARVRRLLLLAAAGVFVLASALAWSLSRRVMKPLLAVRDAAEKMARGDYAVKVYAPGGDELSDLADSVNRLGEALHNLEKGRRSFFANVSHELRTPLSYLRGYSDALAEGLASEPEEVRAYGRILSEEARRLGRLVDDLFDLAKADEGRLEVRLERLDLAAVARRIASRFAASAGEKGVDLRLDGEKAVEVVGDPHRLEQVLFNLCDNALRHTPAGGSIRIAWRAEEREGRALVEVEDSGPGFQGDEERVWERFYRSDRGRSREDGGSGLGLAIVKALVEAHGGGVFARSGSRLGGACVGFWLPLAR